MGKKSKTGGKTPYRILLLINRKGKNSGGDKKRKTVDSRVATTSPLSERGKPIRSCSFVMPRGGRGH